MIYSIPPSKTRERERERERGEDERIEEQQKVNTKTMSSTSTSRPIGACVICQSKENVNINIVCKKIIQQSAKYGINHISANKKDGINYLAPCNVVKILC